MYSAVAMIPWLSFLRYSIILSFAIAMCPNRCSFHGECDQYNRCLCWSGWTGADCSERICSKGVAWHDVPSSDDLAHNLAECSNRGICNRATGRCTCSEGFTGASCERMTCANNNQCNGHGTCQSLKSYAKNYRSTESVQYSYDVPWDSNAITRCVCDAGYAGYDCSVRKCPTGDDPLTVGQVNEVQLIVCRAVSGSFVLVYEDETSIDISFDASVDDVKQALLSISSILDISVSFSGDPTKPACVNSPFEMQVIEVEFTQNFGSLRPMWTLTEILEPLPLSIDPPVIVIADGTSIVDLNGNSYFSVKGTKENVECSNHGICDTSLGVCECYESGTYNFAGSDGYGGVGSRGDCGHEVIPTGTCPGDISCSGHGICNALNFTCNCMYGWTSGDCSQRTCPEGKSWAAYPTDSNTAHNKYTQCSDGGLCNAETGLCECADIFTGSACEYMKCPGDDTNQCSSHGRCLSMSEIASNTVHNGQSYKYGSDPNNSFTWDSKTVHGCMCDEGYTGYDCSLNTCPTGDDTSMWGQLSETQLFACQATSGSIIISFRGSNSLAIPYNANAVELKQFLEDIDTITNVSVVFSSGTSNLVCSSPLDEIVKIEFLTEHGDLPSIQVETSSLVDDNNGGGPGSGTVTIATDGNSLGGITSNSGTTENIDCSGRGLCNSSTGNCDCFDGWFSSNGQGGVGTLGDCGYRIPRSNLHNIL